MYFNLYHLSPERTCLLLTGWFCISSQLKSLQASWWCLQSTAWWNLLLFLRGFFSLGTMYLIRTWWTAFLLFLPPLLVHRRWFYDVDRVDRDIKVEIIFLWKLPELFSKLDQWDVAFIIIFSFLCFIRHIVVVVRREASKSETFHNGAVFGVIPNFWYPINDIQDIYFFTQLGGWLRLFDLAEERLVHQFSVPCLGAKLAEGMLYWLGGTWVEHGWG